MIEGAGDRFVVIVDESKLIPRLPFGCAHTLGLIRKVFDKLAGFNARLGTVKPKDGGEQEVSSSRTTATTSWRCSSRTAYGDLHEVSDRLLQITGIVKHVIFVVMATSVIVAKKDGTVAVLNKK